MYELFIEFVQEKEYFFPQFVQYELNSYFSIFLSIMNSMNHSRAFYSVRAVKTIFF